MNKALINVLLSCLLVSLCVPSSAQSCNNYKFSENRLFRSCSDLSVLNSFLHWNYDEATSTAEIAFRRTGTTTSNWIAWGLNPSVPKMMGTQAIVAYHNTSGQFHAFTTPITSLNPNFQEGSLSFGVSKVSASFVDNEAIIFATLELSTSLVNTNQVWQVGQMSEGSPSSHPLSGDNMRSVGSINFQSGQTTVSGDRSSRIRKGNIHGVLNAVSWGVLMPTGAIFARYLKVFKSADPAWFYLHIACQASAYVIGVAGWATGIKLGSGSPGITRTTHRNIGITLFVFGTLQVFALLLRPKKDHKYRLYWNIYHHSVGYAVIILSIINIFEGFDILQPHKKWERIYIGIIIFLGAVAAILEAFTWFVVLRRKKVGSDKSHSMNGANGANGHVHRAHQGV